MNPAPSKISKGLALVLALAAVAAFHFAYLLPHSQWLIVVFIYCLISLANLASGRMAFYVGMAIGFAIYAPHLAFFYTVFGVAAVSLWCILSLWLGVFLWIGRACLFRFGPVVWAGVAPFLWTGLEYFRSELYYLRFSWLNVGYAFSNSSLVGFLGHYGVYGIGFLLVAWVAFLHGFRRFPTPMRLTYAIILCAISILPASLRVPAHQHSVSVIVTGVQLEFPIGLEAKAALDGALKKYPQSELFVLSEYTFDRPIPKSVRDWCKSHHKWLVAGGEEPVSAQQYYNTAFVIGPDGEVVFQQAKCVPIQFMKDGLPARDQRVWNSPWGKLGLAVCYDASYTRVTDELIRLGAQALIFPTMDVADWGRYQHELHGRIAPMRAAEYAVPIFRLCSSGISQFVQGDGHVAASAPFPGQGALISANLDLPTGGRMPPDRLLALISVAVTAALVVFHFREYILQYGKDTKSSL